MTTIAGVAAVPSFGTEIAEADTAPTSAVPREVYRLAEALTPIYTVQPARCVLLLELNAQDASSLWLATEVGSALAATLKSTVHVLSTAQVPQQMMTDGRQHGACVLESVETPAHGKDRVSVTERLAHLRGTAQPVLLHAEQEDSLPGGLLQGSAVDRIILLARAGHTRRAALQSTVQRLSALGAPLFGCVLLDRTHPLPASLYNRL